MAPAAHARTSIVPHPRYAPLRKQIAFAVGGMLARLLQERSKEVESGARINSMRLLDRLIRNGIRGQALRNADFARIRDMHRRYWSVEGSQFGTAYAFRFEEQFLNRDAELFRLMANKLSELRVEHVCEIGCGNGKVLEYVSQLLPSCARYVGIDIDEQRIEANRKIDYHRPLEFVAGNALDWFRQNVEPGTLLLTNGGVFEYFLESEVREVLGIAAKHDRMAVALIETVGSDHDLENDVSSHLYGREVSFSHNYRHLLIEAGFDVLHHSERSGEGGDRWVRVFAHHIR